MKKKKSPFTEVAETIFTELDQLQSRSMERRQYVTLLKQICWNLKQNASNTTDLYHWQALGLAKGALLGLGETVE